MKVLVYGSGVIGCYLAQAPGWDAIRKQYGRGNTGK